MTEYDGTTLLEAMEEIANDPNTKFGTGKLVGFSTSTQPGIFWQSYCGSKKCKECEQTADNKAIENGEVVGYACKQCIFSIKF